MKKLLIPFLLIIMSGCSQLTSFWQKEEPVIQKDDKQIESDLIESFDQPAQPVRSVPDSDIKSLS